MAEPTLLICPGATKAGTSWLYRYLRDHQACALPAVKELHYYSSFDADERDKKLAVFGRQLQQYQGELAQAQADGVEWKARNMSRRVADIAALMNVLEGDRTGDRAYADFLRGDGSAQLVADISPAYAVLGSDIIERMTCAPLPLKVLFLIRDPLERLWSHIRMHAKRYLRAGQEFGEKSGNVLYRVLNNGQESHIVERGDYKATIQAYQAQISANDFHVEYAENLRDGSALDGICAFLGIAPEEPKDNSPAHVGPGADFPEQKRRRTVKFLRDQYEFIADNFGPMPANWQKNMAYLT